MKKNSIPILVLTAFLWFPFIANAQSGLNEYLETAAENNPQLKARFSQYLAALEKVPQVGTLPDPQVAFAYFIQPVETREGPQQAKFSVTQMLPWFGLLEARKKQATKNAKAAFQSFEQERIKLFHEVRSTYFDYYVSDRAVQITQEHLSILTSQKEWLISKVETGQLPAADEYRLRMEIGDLENQLANLKEQLWARQVGFNKLLHVEAGESIEIPDTLWNNKLQFSYQQILDSTRAGNPQLQKLQFKQEALQHAQEVAKKEGLPDFSLGIDYTLIAPGASNLGGKDAILFPKVGITLPLYRKKYRAMEKEAELNAEATQWTKVSVTNTLESQAAQGWKEYLDAERRVALFKRQVELTKQTVPLLETQYAGGETSFEELLRVERKMLNYKLALEQARADKLKAISYLHFLMGHK